MSGNGVLRISDIRSKDILNTISVEGEVSTIKELHPKRTAAAYKCDSCGHVMHIPVKSSKLESPSSCENEACGNTSGFTFLENECPETDFQEIKIQELHTNSPWILTVDLEGDLVNTINYEDKVIIDGILERGYKKGASIGDFVLNATSIRNYKQIKAVSNDKSEENLKEKMEAIKKIIQELSENSGTNKAVKADVFPEALKLNISKKEAEECITELKRQGDLLAFDSKHIRVI